MKNLHLGSMFLCVSLIGGVLPEAHSEVVPALAGRSWPNHYDTCFSSSWSTMVNNCADTVGGTRRLVIPIQIGGGSTYSITAYAGGNGTDGMTTCQAMSFTNAGTFYDFTYRVQTSASTTIHELPLGAIDVPSRGTLHFECDVAEGGGRVLSVRF